MPTVEPPPGYQLGLDFAPQRATTPPGYALGLEFVRGPLPPRPDPSALRPGGALPAPAIGFGGHLHAAHHTGGAAVRPGGVLPLAAVGIAGRLNAAYDSNVQRPLAHACAAPCQQAQRLDAGPLAAVFDRARQAALQVRDVVQQAQTVAAGVQGRSQQARPLDTRVQDRAQQAQPVRQCGVSAFESTQPLRHAVQDHTQQAQRLQLAALAYAWQIADWRHRMHLERYEQAGIQRHMGLRPPPVLPTPIGWPGWRIALEFAPQFAAPRTWAELQSGPLVATAGLAARLARPADAGRYQDARKPAPALVKTPWPPEGGGEGPDPGGPGTGSTIVIAARKVYIMQNAVTLTRLDTGAPLHAHSFGMSLDYQSWTWSWQASLHHDAADHLGRDAQGDPAELLAQVNGVPFRLRLERIAKERRHLPALRWSVGGKGRAAVLDAPWAPAMSFDNAAGDLSALQLALQALTINGVSIGWGIDWQLEDWLVPQNTWALQGSYIDAINDIAAAAGGYVQPHATDATLRILHTYPVVPWEWGTLTPDYDIPAALAEVESTEYLDKPAYNRVYVGGQGAGVFGPMTRAGTAGERTAPQATHALITAAAAWRQRARAILSDTGRQERVRLSLPVLPETGIITPGQFVRYQGSDQASIGIVRATAIEWTRPRLRQTLELECHEPV